MASKKRKMETSDLEKLRLGGIYIPPFKMRRLAEKLSADEKSEAYQRLQWEALRKAINGPINKVNRHNVTEIVVELFNENIIRGRGLLCRSMMKSQVSSPSFTKVYCAVICIINTKMPEIGDLLCRRVIAQFQRCYRRNDKVAVKCMVQFIGHLINYQVLHELCGLQIVQLLLSAPTNDSIETVKELLLCGGASLLKLAPDAMTAVFQSLKDILQETDGLDVRVQYQLESLFKAFSTNFKDHPAMEPELDLVDEDDLICHNINLLGPKDTEKMLDVFHFDPLWAQHEADYAQIRRQILGEDSGSESDSDDDGDDDSGSSSDSDGDDSDHEEDEDDEDEDDGAEIVDLSNESVMALRRRIYLLMVSALTAEEMAHKMLSEFGGDGEAKSRHKEVSHMVVEACCHERSYRKQYGLMAERMAKLRPEYEASFEELFHAQYGGVHLLDTNKIRNVAKLFAHLLCSDAVDWTVMDCIKLNEHDTNPSKRIFIKILFQEMASFLGSKLKQRLFGNDYGSAFDGLFPMKSDSNPKDTRFAINFFTTIGLGGLTEEMRAYLNLKRKEMARLQANSVESDSDSDSDSDGDDEESDDGSSTDSPSESSSPSDSERDSRSKGKRKRKRRDRGQRDRRLRRRHKGRSLKERRRLSPSSDREVRRRRSRAQSPSRSPPRPSDESDRHRQRKGVDVISRSRSPSRGRWGC